MGAMELVILSSIMRINLVMLSKITVGYPETANSGVKKIKQKGDAGKDLVMRGNAIEDNRSIKV